jgi:magnesium chelatase subunit H
MVQDVPLLSEPSDPDSTVEADDLPSLGAMAASDWVKRLSDYLILLQDRLFSKGLHVFGSHPSDDQLQSYLQAYFGERLTEEECRQVVKEFRKSNVPSYDDGSAMGAFLSFLSRLFGSGDERPGHKTQKGTLRDDASNIVALLDRSSEELDSIVNGLSGGYIRPAPGGDLLRDGPSVLPTGSNIHALDPYRMPSPGAWARGQRAAAEIIRQHRESNNGNYPETIAVTLWGLDAIKTRGK